MAQLLASGEVVTLSQGVEYSLPSVPCYVLSELVLQGASSLGGAYADLVGSNAEPGIFTRGGFIKCPTGSPNVIVKKSDPFMSYSSMILAAMPMAYWRFNEASGTVFRDSTGHGFDLTVIPPAPEPIGYVLNGPANQTDQSILVRSGVNPFTVNRTMSFGRVVGAKILSVDANPTTHLDFSPAIATGATIPDGTPVTQVLLPRSITYGVAGAVPSDPGIGIIGTYLGCLIPNVFLGAGSIELWVNSRDISATKKYSAILMNALDGFGLWIERADNSSPGTPGLKMSWYDNDTGAGLFTVGTFAAGALTHLVMTHNADGTGQFFINGVPDSTYAGLISSFTAQYVACVDYDPITGFLEADLLDEMAIYSYALTPTQVASHYARRGSVSGMFLL